MKYSILISNVKFILLCILQIISLFAFAQPATMRVQGRYLTDICGDTIIFKGINYAAYNWGHDAESELISEIAQTGANAVRIVWYAKPEPTATAYTLANLDTVLARCARYDMIPVLELHDLTCSDKTAAMSLLTNWWTADSVVNILQKHQQYVIINYANEVLNWYWNGAGAAQTARYLGAYRGAVQALRRAGLAMPIMIDAPDCGNNIDLFNLLADTLLAADSLHNLLFSGHAYWYMFAHNNPAMAHQKLQTALKNGVPLVLGEIANYQSDVVECQYILPYQQLLASCESLGIGWLAWGWYQDNCPLRQLSTDGAFAGLTAYGKAVVNDSTFGTQTARRSLFLTSDGGCAVAAAPTETPAIPGNEAEDAGDE